MANLDMQETVLNEIIGNETTQEEIQLTELRPVKQSRIVRNGVLEETNVDVDAEVEVESVTTVVVNATADAFKVLRSFDVSSDYEEQQQQEFQSESNFPTFHRRIERQGKQGRGHGRGEKPRRVINEHGKNNDVYGEADADGELEGSEVEAFKNGGTRKRKKRGDRKDGKSSKGNLLDGDIVGDKQKNEESEQEPNNRQTILGREKTNILLVEYNEEPTYLDLDRSNHLNDEIYVFRREPADSEQRKHANSNNVVDRIYANNYSTTTDGSLFARVAISLREASVVVDDKRNDENENENENENVENESRIIRSEANCLDEGEGEGENNNVVQPNRSKITKDRSTSRRSSEITNEEEKDGAASEDGQQKKYRCVVCEARFKGSGGLRNHYKIVHGAGPVFKCDECGKEFPLKERLKLHVRTHTGFKPYKCSECDKSFARGGQLVQHRRTHSQVKPYRCGLCSGTFTCAANLALHVKRHNGQKDHKCEICGRAFVRRDALKKHLECLHRDVKSFLCVICNKTFKGHLPQHMRTHARDRPHGCATCGQRFAQKSQLTVHQRTHSGQRPFRCLVCWQAFAHSTALKLHTRRHTGERPFKCAECNAGFTQLPHWKKHMKCIHGRNEPYACKKCKSFFRIKNDLECHEKTCHPEFSAEPANLERSINNDSSSDASPGSNDLLPDKPSSPPTPLAAQPHPHPPPSKYRLMTVERMRLLLAVLLKRISKQERLDELGFGRRLIDEVLHDSLISAGKDPVAKDGLSELETLTKNLEIFLKWTVPKEHWENFRRLNKTPEDILETLTAT